MSHVLGSSFDLLAWSFIVSSCQLRCNLISLVHDYLIYSVKNALRILKEPVHRWFEGLSVCSRDLSPQSCLRFLGTATGICLDGPTGLG